MRCIELCRNPARSRQSLLAWVLFNLLTGNADAHLKNLSFRVSPAGVELAPFYDLVSTECYRAEHGNLPRWPDRELSMPIGTARTFAAVTSDDFHAFADQLGVNRRAAARLLAQFTEFIGQAAQDLYAEFETINVPHAAVRAGQLRVLSCIRLIVIRDMLSRLRPLSRAHASPQAPRC